MSRIVPIVLLSALAGGAGCVVVEPTATVPGAPSGLTAVPGDRSATLSWGVPSDGGSAIFGYVVTVSPGGTQLEVGNVSTVILDGLVNGTSYTFRVRARNAIGEGADSAPSNPVVPNVGANKPNAPSGVTATAGNGTATVSWSAPSDGGSPILKYVVNASPGGISVVVSAGTTTLTLTGLTNGTSYTFRVRAQNAVGLSDFSLPSNAVTPTGPSGEPLVNLGPNNYPGYRVRALSATAIPAGGIGFAVTANGSGGYRVIWTDTLNSAATFSGTLTTDGNFDVGQTQLIGSPGLTQTGANQYAFSSVPGAQVDGFDVVSSTDPVYLEAKIGGSTAGVAIYFTGATSNLVQTSAQNPVAFTSP